MSNTIEKLTLNGKNNFGKTYRKTAFKQRQIKYVSLEAPLNERLKKASDISGLSQSYIIGEALLDFFEKHKIS